MSNQYLPLESKPLNIHWDGSLFEDDYIGPGIRRRHAEQIDELIEGPLDEEEEDEGSDLE